jgi:Nucleotide-diphospho-sugar transferase
MLFHQNDRRRGRQGRSKDLTLRDCLCAAGTLTLIVMVAQRSQLRGIQQQRLQVQQAVTSDTITEPEKRYRPPMFPTGTSLFPSTTEETKLPDWRLSVDCTVWDYHCITIKQGSGLYQDYPFPYTRHYEHEHLYEWTVLDGVPLEWQPELTNDEASLLSYPPPRPTAYIYKDQVSDQGLEACLQNARQNPWKDQLSNLISSGQIRPDNDTNLLSFTISDFNYAKDMIHEVFEMNDHVVGFSDAFFMVAIDFETLELACRYQYPVIAWPSAVQANSTEELKHSVANTKFEVSLALVEQQQSFFFYEMDVWFIKSPKSILRLFDGDMLLSAHQNCPFCINIGVYLTRANEKTKEYFQVAIQLAKDSPNTHDQWIMAQIYHMQESGDKFNYGDSWNPIPTYLPQFVYRVQRGDFSPHEIVADERPYASQMALAIHPLRETPLKDPHGKKMVAKEMGAWYGFQGPVGEAGYYARKGISRRFIMMDGHILNGYSTVMNWEFINNESGIYHDLASLKWTIAVLVALARRTGRILVLPPVARDSAVHFLWTMLDLKSIEDIGVDYRETTFLNNPKSWVRPGRPFDTVARTALGAFQRDGTMFAQYSTASDTDETRAWMFNRTEMDEVDAIDAWWSLHVSNPQVDAAELLLVNPHFVKDDYHGPLSDKLRRHELVHDPTTGRGRAEHEITSVFAKLRWCPDKDDPWVADHGVGVFKSSRDCYSQGES